jgi:hypothetical protein
MVGPLREDQDGSSTLIPVTGIAGTYPYIMPATLPMFVLGNITSGLMTSKITYDFFDGRTLAKVWRSPEFPSMGFGGMDIISSQADSDPAREIMISESSVDISMNFKSTLHVYSDNNFTEEWTSDEYPAIMIFGVGLDLVGDPSPELLLQVQKLDIGTGESTSQTLILDGDSHAVLWTGPEDSRDDGNFTDLYGSPLREIVHIAVNQSRDRTSSSTISVYNDTTYAPAWTSGEQEGEASILAAEDIDGDGVGEIVTSLAWEDQDRNRYTNITER